MTHNGSEEAQSEHSGGNEGHSRASSLSAELAKDAENNAIDYEVTRREDAWQKYTGYDERYEHENEKRAASGTILVERYPSATLVASIRLDENREAISGHDYSPEAKSHKDIEKEFSNYIETVPPHERFVVFEGGYSKFNDRDEAIQHRADAGLNMFLADQAEIESVTGDPTDLEVADYLKSQGIPLEETALLTTLRSLGSKLVKRPDTPIDPGGDIYFQLARNGVSGFREYSEAEKMEISKDPAKVEALLSVMSEAGVRVAIETFNPQLRELGLPEFVVAQDGNLNLPGLNGTQLVEMSGPVGDGKLNKIARMVTEYRDHHLFAVITDAVSRGKKPFVVYGGSHVVALKPALDKYFYAEA